MSRRISSFVVPASLLGALASAANGGPGCVEGTADAGSARASARVCYGVGPLPVVSGTLSSARDGQAIDFEDMFLIRITDPEGFSASTQGAVAFDTQLWLLRPDNSNKLAAFGVLANDEVLGGPAGPSRLAPPATDGTGQTIPGPGLYLLAISGFNNDPLSAGGAIFNQAIRTEISGPDGPGGAGIHTAWSGAGAVGTYSINLTGAAYVPLVPAASPAGVGVLALLVIGAGTAIFRRVA